MKIILRKLLTIVLLLTVFFGAYELYRPIPKELQLHSTPYRVADDSISFYSDRTYVDAKGVRYSEQEIFDEIFLMINRAREYILIDMFLFNDFQGEQPERTRLLSSELTDILIKKKEQFPGIYIAIITDPINTVYGGDDPLNLNLLRKNNIDVVITDLTYLKDSNRLYSSVWRGVIRWFGNSTEGGIFTHPFSSNGRKVTLRSYLELLNFKANHRKLIIADDHSHPDGTKMSLLVTSANPHDGSSAHSNIAVKIDDMIWRDALRNERNIADISGIGLLAYQNGELRETEGDTTVQFLVEKQIRTKIIEQINKAQHSDRIDMVMFYLSDRKVIKALIEAINRGVEVRMILDPNKDAFGYTKNGIPNRQVAYELLKKTQNRMKLRWCDTHGEQCHSKLTLFTFSDGYSMILGSANLTRRNIGGFNLEADVLVESAEHIQAMADAQDYFDEIWENKDGKIYTVDYEKYKDTAYWKYLLYRAMESTGLSAF